MQEDSRTDLVSLFNVGGSPPSEEVISNLLANRYKRKSTLYTTWLFQLNCCQSLSTIGIIK